MHIIYHDHAVNKFTKLVTLDLLATNVFSKAKVQLIKITGILKNWWYSDGTQSVVPPTWSLVHSFLGNTGDSSNATTGLAPA